MREITDNVLDTDNPVASRIYPKDNKYLTRNKFRYKGKLK